MTVKSYFELEGPLIESTSSDLDYNNSEPDLVDKAASSSANAPDAPNAVNSSTNSANTSNSSIDSTANASAEDINSLLAEVHLVCFDNCDSIKDIYFDQLPSESHSWCDLVTTTTDKGESRVLLVEHKGYIQLTVGGLNVDRGFVLTS